MNIGDILHTSAEREAAPVGAVIRLTEVNGGSYEDTWTKGADGMWAASGSSRSPRPHSGNGWLDDTNPAGYVVEAWPVVRPQVGEPINSYAERDALPMGTMVHITNDPDNDVHHRTKTPAGWTRAIDSSVVRLDNLRSDGYFTVRSLPDSEPVSEPTSAGVEPGTISDYAALLMLPVGSVFYSEAQPTARWVVDSDEYAIREGDTHRVRVRLSVFEGPANAGCFRTGSPTEEPVPDHLPVGAEVHEFHELEALPVGTVLMHRGPTQTVRRTKIEGELWSRDGYGDTRTRRIRLNGWFTVESVPTPVVAVACPAVGVAIQATEQFEAMPEGSVVTTGPNQWTKRGSHWLINDDPARGPGIPNEEMTPAGYNTVVRIGEAEPVFAVGSEVTTNDQLDLLPVGTVIRWNRVTSAGVQHERTKQEDGRWRRDFSDIAAANLTMDDGWTIVTLPGAPIVLEIRPEVGMPVNNREDFDALPVGTALRGIAEPANEGFRWVKQNTGVWQHASGVTITPWEVGDGVFAVHSLPSPEVAEVAFAIGMEIETVEQYAALPIYSVVMEESPGHYPIVKRAEDTWQDQATTWSTITVAGTSRTLVALPQAPATQPVAEGDGRIIALAEHDRILDEQRRIAVEVRNEEVLATMREAWDGVSLTRSEVNDLLESLGFTDEVIDPDATELITVTVDVAGNSTLDSTDVERLFEGAMSASVDSTHVTWDIDGIDFSEVEVPMNQCGCDLIDRDMVRSRLESSEVSFDDFTYTANCENC